MVRTKSTKFAYISTSQFVERTQVCNLTVCGGRFAQTNIGWTKLDRKPRFRIQTVALTKTTTNFCSVPIVMETWPRRNQIDRHGWNDNNWHSRRRLHVASWANATVKCFLGNLHCSPHLCEFTTVVIWLHTPTNKQTSCWCEQLHHMNISRTWFLCFAASTHMFNVKSWKRTEREPGGWTNLNSRERRTPAMRQMATGTKRVDGEGRPQVDSK